MGALALIGSIIYHRCSYGQTDITYAVYVDHGDFIVVEILYAV